MGFFDWVKEKARDIKWWVEDRIDDIKDFFDRSYDEDGSVDDIIFIENRLTELRKKTKRSLTRFTNEPREAFENCFNEVVGLLEEGDLPDKYKIDLTDFKAQIASTSREITDRITRHYDRRVSLDDDECVEILEIYDNAERKEEFKEFQKTVFDEIEDEVIDFVDKKSNDLYKDLKTILENSLITSGEQLANAKESLEKIEKGDLAEKEREQLNSLIVCKAANAVLAITN